MNKVMKFAGITYLVSFVAGIAALIWMYAFPKSYGKFVNRLSEKVFEEEEEEY